MIRNSSTDATAAAICAAVNCVFHGPPVVAVHTARWEPGTASVIRALSVTRKSVHEARAVAEAASTL